MSSDSDTHRNIQRIFYRELLTLSQPTKELPYNPTHPHTHNHKQTHTHPNTHTDQGTERDSDTDIDKQTHTGTWKPFLY